MSSATLSVVIGLALYCALAAGLALGAGRRPAAAGGASPAWSAGGASPAWSAGGASPAWSMTAALLGVFFLWVLPAGVAGNGLPFAYFAHAGIVVAVVLLILARRLWTLGRHLGVAGGAPLLGAYFESPGLGRAAIALAALVALPILAFAFRETGALASTLSGGHPWAAAAAKTLLGVLLAVQAGLARPGLGRLGLVQCLLVLAALVVAGDLALDAVGGGAGLGEALARVGADPETPWGRTEGRGGGDFAAYLAIPGMMQGSAGLDVEAPAGSPWTGTMLLSGALLAVGAAISPLGLSWIAAERRTGRFGGVWAWLPAGAFSGAAVVFAVAAGLGAGLGAAPAPWQVADALAAAASAWPAAVVPLALAAAWHALATAALVGFGRYTDTRPPDDAGGGRGVPRRRLLQAALLLVAALMLSDLPSGVLMALVVIGLALAVQMLPALLGAAWWPWLTAPGAGVGLGVGVAVTLAADLPGVMAQTALWTAPLWGPHPLTVHAAAWGLIANLTAAVLVSAATQETEAGGRRLARQQTVDAHAGIPGHARGLVPAAWIFVAGWALFALGPGAVIGNTIFGRPDHGADGWSFGLPSIWSWQIAGWGGGVLLVWFLAARLGLGRRVDGTPAAETDAPGRPRP